MTLSRTSCFFKFKKFSELNRFTTAHTSNAVYIIGGEVDGSHSETIYQFTDGKWSEHKTFNQVRSNHGTIKIGDEVMIIGGRGSRLVACTKIIIFVAKYLDLPK